MARRPSRFPFLLITAGFLLVLFLLRSWWLPAIGRALIHDDGPGKADIAVVLAGDYHGRRIVKGGELVRAGYVPLVLVSGPPNFYGHHESDLAIPFAVAHGFPAEWFAPVPHDGLSTKTEGEVMLAELRRRQVKSFLLVTSDFHTARARRIYLALERKEGGGPAVRTVAAPDEFFQSGSWWHSREGQKTVFIEWSKTVATVFGF